MDKKMDKTKKKGLTSEDRKNLVRFASTLPKGSEERKVILAGIREAMEHSSPEALKKYLRDHPNADKSKHTVKKDEQKGKGKSEAPPKNREEAASSYEKGLAVKDQLAKELRSADKEVEDASYGMRYVPAFAESRNEKQEKTYQESKAKTEAFKVKRDKVQSEFNEAYAAMEPLKAEAEAAGLEFVGNGYRKIKKMDETKKKAGSRGHHYTAPNGDLYADTAFLNGTNRIPGVTLEHMGFGEFYADTPKGRVDFDRMRGKDFPGKSGRSHKLYGPGAEWLVAEMASKGKSEDMASQKKAVTLKGRLAKLAFDNPDMREALMPLLTKTVR